MKRFLLAWVLIAQLGCGSQLDNAIKNEAGCKVLSEALREKCPDPTELRWLNCDELPGCPGGEVEESDVQDCKRRILAAPTCIDAKAVSCEIRRLDCQDPAGEIGIPSELKGYVEICPEIVGDLNSKGACVFEDTDPICATLLGCSGGVFNLTDVRLSLTTVEEKAKEAAATTCEAYTAIATTEFGAVAIRHKYCLPLDTEG